MPLNFELAGKTYEGATYRVSAEPVERYAAATDGPLHRREGTLLAPPVFPVVPAFPLMTRISRDPELRLEDPLKILHGEQEFRYHRPLRVGDDLILNPTLERVDDKGSGATFVVRIDGVTGEGEPVVDQWWTIFVRGAGTGRKGGERTAATVPERRGERARFTQEVDEDMPSRYAEASGDRNLIHLNREVARSVGLPGVINHGLGTLALVSGGLLRELTGGDPSGLARLRARFTAPVFPGSKVTTTVWETDEPRSFLYETARDDDRRAMVGEVEVHG